MSTPEHTQVFISESHADVEWLRRLPMLLTPLTRNHTITRWDDTTITAGTKWREEIQQTLAADGAFNDSRRRIRCACRGGGGPFDQSRACLACGASCTQLLSLWSSGL